MMTVQLVHHMMQQQYHWLNMLFVKYFNLTTYNIVSFFDFHLGHINNINNNIVLNIYGNKTSVLSIPYYIV
jgi:hypothetical protein